MAHSPSPLSPWPGVSDVTPEPGEDNPQEILDPAKILSALREQIAVGTQELDVLLGAITVAAEVLTNANGAALALYRDGAAVCVGRSGETAPAIGARISADSGISGECLRAGRTLRCDDTELDTRVDAEVCRHLGIRSIAAVPCRSRMQTAGLLEAFSSSAYAFNDDHMSLLANLAELADIANSGTDKKVEEVATPDAAVEPEIVTPASTLPLVPEVNLSWLQHPAEPQKKRWYYLAAVGAVLLVALLATAGWRAWHAPRQTNFLPPKTQLQSSTAAPATSETAQSVLLPQKPGPGELASKPKLAAKQVVVPASLVEEDDVTVRKIPSAATNSAANSTNAAVDSSSSEAPQVAMLNPSGQGLGSLVTGSVSVPKLDVRVSEGVTPLVLQHKVFPHYPADAIAMNAEGVVVLHASINEQGHPEDITLVSGNPLLGSAAIDAVKQWRYRPSRLNDRRIRVETDITFNFKLSEGTR